MVSHTGLLETEHYDGVAYITMTSAHNRNALSRQMLRELLSALSRASQDEDVRSVILTGSGSAFCSGLDLKERVSVVERATSEAFVEVLMTLQSISIPVIASVNGSVRAGGIALIGACDVAVADATATFAISETRVGLAPAMTIAMLKDLVEPHALRRFALTGEIFSASVAQQIGLLAGTAEPGSVSREVKRFTDALKKCSPSAVAETKSLLRLHVLGDSMGEELERGMRKSDVLFASNDAVEGISAYMEGRLPKWFS